MAWNYLRDTSDNKIIQTIDSEEDVPTGHDKVNPDDITDSGWDGPCFGGTWDGTDFVPIEGLALPFDLSTTLGQLQFAASKLHDAYVALDDRLEGPVAKYFPQLHRGWAHDFTAYAHHGTRAVFLSDDLTPLQKLTWASFNGAGPTDVPEENRAAFFGVVAASDFGQDNVPTSRILFAHPVTTVRWTLGQCVSNTSAE